MTSSSLLLADLADHKAEAHAALGDVAVLGPRLLLGLALVGEGLAGPLQVVLELLPDAVELVVDQRRRQLELVRLLELVEQLALELHARGVWRTRADLPPTSSLACASAFGAERLGELVVDRRARTGFATSLTLTSKSASLPASVGDRIVVGERGIDVALLAGLGAVDALLEARDELPWPRTMLGVLARAALELLAVDLADEVDGDAVAVRRAAALPRRRT